MKKNWLFVTFLTINMFSLVFIKQLHATNNVCMYNANYAAMITLETCNYYCNVINQITDDGFCAIVPLTEEGLKNYSYNILIITTL